jgi:hypothetical protein
VKKICNYFTCTRPCRDEFCSQHKPEVIEYKRDYSRRYAANKKELKANRIPVPATDEFDEIDELLRAL